MKVNYKTAAVSLAGIAFGALAMMPSGIETALAQDTVRVRGTIERIDGSTYVVKARDGAELKVALADNPRRGQGIAFRHQAGLVRGCHGDAAG